jgi:hypothetical protein
MDSMESINPLDGTDSRGHTNRLRNAVHLHALLQLPDRFLPPGVSHSRRHRILASKAC